MNNYIASSNIIAYPAARRQSVNSSNGTLLTESRLSSVVNSLLDINGFVTYPLPGDVIGQESEDRDKILKINILGRYFKIFNPIVSLGLDASDSGSIYLGINIDKTGSEDFEIYYEIQGQDNDGSYEGIRIFNFSSSDNIHNNDDNTYRYVESETDKVYTCIKVAEKIGNNWYVPEPEYSKIRFIDAGEI